MPGWRFGDDGVCRRSVSMRPICLAGAALVAALAGCAPQRPGFLVRLQQDCAAGDRDACVLVAGPAVASDSFRPSQAAPKPRTAVQRDVEAIMQGMDRNHALTRLQVDPDEGS